MKCPNCGHEVKEGQAFCTNCGARLTGADGDVQAEGAANGPEGQARSSARPNICPFCGSPLPEGSEFCPSCGKSLTGDNDTPAGGTVSGGATDSISHTQAMPVIPPQTVQRREAVPSPPQTPYAPEANKRDAGKASDPRNPKPKRSRAPFIALGSVVAVVVVALVVVFALGADPLASANTNDSDQNVTAAQDNTNETDATTSNSNANTNANATTSAVSNVNASSTANSANTNANTAGSTNANTNANTHGDDEEDDSHTDDHTTTGSVTINNGYVYNSNSAYGYSLTVPTTFTLSGSDANGNATLADTASPCVITVSVDDNPNGYTVDQALADASRGSTSGAYTAEGNGWYVFSDEPDGTVYYIMSYVRQGRTISLRFSYPTSAKSQCDPIIESVQPTFSVN